MSFTGVVNLAETLLNQTSAAQELQAVPEVTPASTIASGTTAGNTDTALPIDQFVPSSQTGAANASAEAAGLFQATQIPLFSAAADTLLAQAPAQTNLAPATQPTNTLATLVPESGLLTAQGGTQTAAQATALPDTTQAGANVIDANGNIAAAPTLSQPNPAATDAAAASSANTANAIGGTALASSGALSIQAELQSLNNSLAGLGLSAADIQKVDQIASLIQDFNPTAFSSLVFQLEGLAANAARAAAQAPAANGNATNPSTTAVQPANTTTNAIDANAPTDANTNGLVFQGLQLQLNFANNNGPAGPVQQTVGVTATLAPAQTRAATA